MKRRSVTIWLVVGLMLLAGALAACSEEDAANGEGFVHVVEGEAETQVAQTAAAMVAPTETPGATEPPTTTPTPYSIPTDDPAIDGDAVITRVGSEEITLDDYRQRVRFDRYRLLYPIVKLAEKYGTEELLDLTDDNNWYVASLFATLNDSYSFGAQVHRIMVIEVLAEQEARRRGVEVNPYLFDANMGEWLGLQVGENGNLPPEYEDRYLEFVKGIRTYAGMSEEELRRIVRAQTYYDQLEFLISHEADLNTSGEAAVGVQVQDIVVQEQVEAEEIAARLLDNEPLRDIAISLGYAAANLDTDRVLRRSDKSLPDQVIETIFLADQGDVVGPMRVPDGWYVGKIGTDVVDVLSPEDIDQLRKDYFLNWVEAQMDDPAMVEDFDNWITYTPQEPLPQDVSPLLRDENVTQPEGVVDPFDASLYPEGTGTPDADGATPADAAPDDAETDANAGS